MNTYGSGDHLTADRGCVWLFGCWSKFRGRGLGLRGLWRYINIIFLRLYVVLTSLFRLQYFACVFAQFLSAYRCHYCLWYWFISEQKLLKCPGTVDLNAVSSVVGTITTWSIVQTCNNMPRMNLSRYVRHATVFIWMFTIACFLV